jgi:quercetin dioxygenase-like cupin family protein
MGEDTYDIVNPRTGQRMRFVPDATGEVLRIDTVNAPAAAAEPTHVHPRQTSSAHVVSGRLRFVVDGVVHDLGPGQDITIEPGVPHSFLNPGEEDAVSIQEFRPALRSEQLFRALFALDERGEINDSGMPSLLHLAVLVPAFADEIRVTRPPWPVQRAVFAVLGPIAKRRGYRVP